MSTYVVTFLGDASEKFRGRVRHVATGEEAKFSSVTDLLVFFEEMNAVSGLNEKTGSGLRIKTENPG
jgi:hypothetical protein